MNLLIASIPCWLIPLLVGAICAILGYLLGRLLKEDNSTPSNDTTVDVYKNRIAKLEADLTACKESKKSTFTSGNSFVDAGVSTDTSTSAVSGIAALAFNAAAAKAVFGKKINDNDLTVVEGIGPKIKELFHSHDIKTWAQLGDSTVEQCQKVLNSGGDRYKMHKPGTWPKQAKLAASGEWQKLKDLQDTLDGGK